MAVLRGDSGFRTPGIQNIASRFGLGGAGSGFAAPQQQLSEWDMWANHFMPPPAVPVAPGLNWDTELEMQFMRSPAYRERQSAVRQQQADRVRLRKLAEQAGVDPENSTELGKLWMQAVREAEAAAAVTPGVTPWDILERWTKEGAPGTFKREEMDRKRRDEYFAKELDPYTVTRTAKNIQLTDPDTARAVITAHLERMLGRRPNDAEIKDFVAALNKSERANPTVTTTVEQYAYDADAGSYQQVSSSSTTTGGAADPNAFASNFIEDEFEAEERAHRAGVEYTSVMEALTGSL